MLVYQSLPSRDKNPKEIEFKVYLVGERTWKKVFWDNRTYKGNRYEQDQIMSTGAEWEGGDEITASAITISQCQPWVENGSTLSQNTWTAYLYGYYLRHQQLAKQ